MSCLITSVNSVRPSPVAPKDASVRSCARRASDSIIRSSTTRRAQAQPADRLDGAAALLQWRQQPGKRETAGAREHEAREDRGLRPELQRRGSQQDDRKERHQDAEDEAAGLAVGHRSWIGNHEKRKDQYLRRGHEDLPEL